MRDLSKVTHVDGLNYCDVCGYWIDSYDVCTASCSSQSEGSVNFSCPHFDQCNSSQLCQARQQQALANNTRRNVPPELAFNTWRPELMAELQRFREREPLVQDLLCMTTRNLGAANATVIDAADLVRDFDLRRQCVAETSDTGDDPEGE